MLKITSLPLFILIIISGCTPKISQENLIQHRQDFNSAVIRSWDEQMLMNIVRLRYRDNPMFLEVGNVVAYQSTKIAGNLGGEINLAPTQTGKLSTGASGEMVLAPTVTYTPLQGEEFAKRMLSPIPPSTIFLLSQSGWSLERLLLCCVQQMNGISNAVSASGPTPEFVPEYELFHRLSRSLRQLQISRSVQFEMEKDGETMAMLLMQPKDPRDDTAAAVFKSTLGLSNTPERFRVTSKRTREKDDEIALTGRSLLSVLFFLSQSVEVPVGHEIEGKVTVTKYPDGRKFDWNEVTGSVMRIRSSENEPAEAAVKIFYRDVWFYISDDDLNSKTTFTLLSFLFNLQAANKSGGPPVMTYPIR